MNVLIDVYEELRSSAISLRESNTVGIGPDLSCCEETRAEIDRLDRLVTLFGHALVTLGLMRASK